MCEVSPYSVYRNSQRLHHKEKMKEDDNSMSLLGRMEEEAELRGENKASENIALNLIKAGKLALDEIANVCSLTLQRVQELAKTAS